MALPAAHAPEHEPRRRKGAVADKPVAKRARGTNNAGKVVMERSTAAVNKQMENDPQNVVGKAEEVRVLQGELRNELASQVLRRISFFAANAN